MSNEKVPVKFKGLVRWASVPPNPPRKPFEIDTTQPDNSSYSIEVECSAEKFKQLQKSGIPKLTSLREDEETGKTYIRLKATKVKGDITFPDPWVIDKNEKKVEEAIGNGSEAIVVAELSPIKGRGGKALRLVGVQVLNHIPFEGGGMKKYKDLLESEESLDTPTNSSEETLNDLF